MADANQHLEDLIQQCMAALADPSEGTPAAAEATMRERFFELMVLILGNLYAKTPIAAPLMDRNTMLRAVAGMDDGDAGKLTGRGEDWLRLEGILRQQDGAKAYFLTRQTLATLSANTSAGTLGDIMNVILARYQQSMPTEEIRRVTRLLGSHFLSISSTST